MKGTKRTVQLPDEEKTLVPNVKIATFDLGKYKNVQCVSLAGLSALSGKTSGTLKDWEKKGWLPPANFRNESPSSQHGERLYSLEFAAKMAVHMRKALSGIAVTTEITTPLYALNKEEQNKFIKK